MDAPFNSSSASLPPAHQSTGLRGLSHVLGRLQDRMARDQLVQHTVDILRHHLDIDRVVLYYFYKQWDGQVTFESLSAPTFSILGSTGPDQCFGDDYAERYLAGRIRAIEDIHSTAIAPCHRDFLSGLQVRANLVVPVLTQRGLWGLLAAHHCQAPRPWSQTDIDAMQSSATTLAAAPSIVES